MGSAGTTRQLAKLGIKPGLRWDVDGADPGWRFEEEPDPADRVTAGEADVVLAFVRELADLAPAIVAHERRIFPDGALWVAWPRKAAGHVSDVTENAIRDAALPRGLVDVKVAAIDHDWSGLKLVWRKALRR
ncbi:DUF3052 family protein [Asanoa iriomotensis]|uniref:DUF3052 domain-containing protein n=1 Tax=Asanoa iriomotensis TaxID=234613 RepID=A0ABQ4C1X7_9ACTN|nr:DUF3052 family protein [Asanoa iriomotensis]GIF56759.1 DUF3052 domain-containing protein [Asanoa iriomotensis]